MNAQTKLVSGDAWAESECFAFFRLRSDMLDLFADVEREICAFLKKHEVKSFCPTAPLGHKVDLAKAVKAGPLRSKDTKAKADNALNELEKLLLLRATIVHSRMEFALTSSGCQIALFKNSNKSDGEFFHAFVLSLKDMKDFLGVVKAICSKVVATLYATNPPPVQKPKAATKATTPK